MCVRPEERPCNRSLQNQKNAVSVQAHTVGRVCACMCVCVCMWTHTCLRLDRTNTHSGEHPASPRQAKQDGATLDQAARAERQKKIIGKCRATGCHCTTRNRTLNNQKQAKQHCATHSKQHKQNAHHGAENGATRQGATANRCHAQEWGATGCQPWPSTRRCPEPNGATASNATRCHTWQAPTAERTPRSRTLCHATGCHARKVPCSWCSCCCSCCCDCCCCSCCCCCAWNCCYSCG